MGQLEPFRGKVYCQGYFKRASVAGLVSSHAACEPSLAAASIYRRPIESVLRAKIARSARGGQSRLAVSLLQRPCERNTHWHLPIIGVT